jgi:hypothetical protein
MVYDVFSFCDIENALSSGEVIPVDKFQIGSTSKLSFFTINGSEYELGTGIHKGKTVIKVRYGRCLTPLYIKGNQYFVNSFRGMDEDNKAQFEEINGTINDRTSSLELFRSKNMDIDMSGPAKKSKSHGRTAPYKQRAPRQLSPHEQNLMRSELERKERLNAIKQVKKDLQHDVVDLSDLMGLFGVNKNSGFGKSKSKKLSKYTLLMNDLKSLRYI